MVLSLEGARRFQPPAASDARVREPRPPPEASVRAHFHALLRRLGTEVDRGEALVEKAERGRYESMDLGTLIALQAGIYRYGEAVDLTVRLVDRATNTAKVVLESSR